MAQNKTKLNRRNFLLAVGAGSVATAAAIVSKSAPPQESTKRGTGKRATRGYVASEHVNSYYRTTKV